METILSMFAVTAIPLVSAVFAKWLSSRTRFGRAKRLFLASALCPMAFLLFMLGQYVLLPGFDEAGLGIIIIPIFVLAILALGIVGACLQGRFWRSRS